MRFEKDPAPDDTPPGRGRFLDARRARPSGKLDVTALLCLAGTTICWGVVPPMLRWLKVEGHVPDGFTSNFVRYPVACALYLPLVILIGRRGGVGRFWILALIPTLVNVIGQTLWAWSPYFLEANMMAFMGRTSVVWAILGAFLVFPEERRIARSPEFWIGLVLAFGGFVLMSLLGADAQADSGTGNSVFGIVLMGVCAVCWGMYGVTVRYVIGDRHPLFVFGVIGGYTSIALLLMGPLGEPSAIGRLTLFPLVVLIGSAVLGIAVAHGLYYVAIKRIGVAVTTLGLMMAPFITLAGSALILGERFSPGQWLGGVTLVIGSSLAVRAQQRLSPPHLVDPHELGNE